MTPPVHLVLHLIFGGLELHIWDFAEGNRSDLGVVQILQLPSAALAPITLGSCSAGFYSLSRLKASCVCLCAPWS